jgi:phosphosulfolactate phosphohydrolase-like enzyme
MAYIKVKEWQSAESDATAAINLDPFHIKSYQRRSMARSSQGKLRASLHDLYRARMILSGIKETNEEMHRIHSDIDKIESLLLQAIKKAPKKLIPIISTENKINT